MVPFETTAEFFSSVKESLSPVTVAAIIACVAGLASLLATLWKGYYKIPYGRVGIKFMNGRPVVRRWGFYKGLMYLHGASLRFALFGFGEYRTETSQDVVTPSITKTLDFKHGQFTVDIAFVYGVIEQPTGWMRVEDCFALMTVKAREGNLDAVVAGLLANLLTAIVNRGNTLAQDLTTQVFQDALRMESRALMQSHGLELRAMVVSASGRSLGQMLKGTGGASRVVTVL